MKMWEVARHLQKANVVAEQSSTMKTYMCKQQRPRTDWKSILSDRACLFLTGKNAHTKSCIYVWLSYHSEIISTHSLRGK